MYWQKLGLHMLNGIASEDAPILAQLKIIQT
jgi:hypothetical protein